MKCSSKWKILHSFRPFPLHWVTPISCIQLPTPNSTPSNADHWGSNADSLQWGPLLTPWVRQWSLYITGSMFTANQKFLSSLCYNSFNALCIHELIKAFTQWSRVAKAKSSCLWWVFSLQKLCIRDSQNVQADAGYHWVNDKHLSVGSISYQLPAHLISSNTRCPPQHYL